MSKRSFKLSEEDRLKLFEIRDALILKSNSIEASEIMSMGRLLDEVLKDMVREVPERSLDEGQMDRKRSAITIGLLSQGLEDIHGLFSSEIKGVDLDAKRRIAKSGGVRNYVNSLKNEAERVIKGMGFSKKDVKTADF